MAKRAVLSLAALLGAVFIAGSLSGCFLFGGPGISGKVYNALSGGGLYGVTVTINDFTGDSYSTTTDSTGYWFISSPHDGVYGVSASAGGCYFTSPATAVVYKSGSTITAPNIAGVQDSSMGTGELAFVLMWLNDGSTNLNIHMTYPDEWRGDNGTTFGTPYETQSTNWDTGFGVSQVNTFNTDRAITNFAYPSGHAENTVLPAVATVNGNAALVSTSTSGGPETIALYTLPFASGGNGTYPIAASTTNGLPGVGVITYNWQGVGEIYVDAPGTTMSSLGGSTVNPVVFAFGQGQGLIGVYTIPTNTNVPAASVVRINMFLDSGGGVTMELAPDIGVIPGGGGVNGGNFRSISAAAINPIVSVKMPAKR